MEKRKQGVYTYSSGECEFEIVTAESVVVDGGVDDFLQ